MSLTIGILSWGAYDTLYQTLDSYRLSGLDRLGDERVIFFQEINERDKSIAKQYGYEAIGSDTNIGIAQGYASLVNYATSDLFLFLENDWKLLYSPTEQIYAAEIMLSSQEIDVARFRSRHNPGVPLWTAQFKGNEYLRPTHLLDCLYYLEDWEINFPEISKASKVGWYKAFAYYANWTNNPTMFRTDFLRRAILPRIGNGDAEQDLQGWWEQKSFIVAQGDGLFTHSRIG